MKVLLLTQVLPYPPDSGPKIKTWNVLKYLAQQHEVTLVSFVRGDQSQDIQHLKPYCKAIYTTPMKRGILRDLAFLAMSLVKNQPFIILRDDRKAMQELVDHLSGQEQFDIVHADQLNMAQYAQRVSSARKILDAHNALWLLYKRLWQTMPVGPRKWLLKRDWNLMKAYEGAICREFFHVLAVSEEDKSALEEAAGVPLNLTIIPIAVDTEQISFIRRRGDANDILHIGTMFWPPNVDGVLWFLREVLPMIYDEQPKLRFNIIGANPPPEIVAFEKSTYGVYVTGYVEDPMPYYLRTGVMVVPLRAGGGMRVKILNALAQGLPIVTTTIGCEGIEVESGRHLLVADTAESFAQATLLLLNDRKFAQELGRNGRELIQTKYDYRVACRTLDRVYMES